MERGGREGRESTYRQKSLSTRCLPSFHLSLFLAFPPFSQFSNPFSSFSPSLPSFPLLAFDRGIYNFPPPLFLFSSSSSPSFWRKRDGGGETGGVFERAIRSRLAKGGEKGKKEKKKKKRKKRKRGEKGVEIPFSSWTFTIFFRPYFHPLLHPRSNFRKSRLCDAEETGWNFNRLNFSRVLSLEICSRTARLHSRRPLVSNG